MESAGPKIILDRLKEEWNNPVDEEASEELTLEKQLWVLTAFQLQNLGRYSRFPKTNTGKILELYGNLGELLPLVPQSVLIDAQLRFINCPPCIHDRRCITSLPSHSSRYHYRGMCLT
jgi:hypothetical protein